MSSKIKILFYSLVVSIIVGNIGYSQDINTMYFMYNVPQTNLLNPAYQPTCNFYLGIPGVSPLGIDITNSSLNVNTLFIPKPDSLVSVLHPSVTDAERLNFVDGLRDINYLRTNADIYLLNFGFSLGSSLYFNFHVAEKFRTSIDYPRDLANIMMFGLKQGETYDLSGFGWKMSSYGEVGLGASYKISEDFVVGGKLKTLLGQYDFGMKKQDIKIDVDVLEWNITSKFDLVGNMPFLEGIDNTNVLDSLQGNLKNIDKDEYINDLKSFGNIGFGLDLGATYSPMNNLTVSASIIDLGYIRWSSNTNVLSQDTSFTFYGLEGLKLTKKDDDAVDTSSAAVWDNVIDSLQGNFNTVISSDPYSSMLSAKIYIGAKYELTEKVGFGFLTKTEIYRKKLYPQVTLSANVRPIKAFTATASYTLLTGEYSSFGLGLNFKGGPINWYVVSDNIPTSFASGKPIPIYAKGVRFLLGFNVMIGTRGKKKGGMDIPLI